MNPEQAGEMLLERFGQLTYQFLDASAEVWNTCPVLKQWKEKYDEANSDPRKAKIFVQVLFAEFTRDFKPYYSRLTVRDASVFEEPFAPFVKVQASEKYKTASKEIQDTCWDYIGQIVQQATIGDVYAKCPDSMIKKIATMADTLVNDIQKGNFDISKLNPMEISKQMMEGMNPEELEAMGKSLMDSGNLDSIMGLMGNLLNGGTGIGGVQIPGVTPEMIQGIMQNMTNGGDTGLPPGLLPPGFDLSMFMKKK